MKEAYQEKASSSNWFRIWKQFYNKLRTLLRRIVLGHIPLVASNSHLRKYLMAHKITCIFGAASLILLAAGAYYVFLVQYSNVYMPISIGIESTDGLLHFYRFSIDAEYNAHGDDKLVMRFDAEYDGDTLKGYLRVWVDGKVVPQTGMNYIDGLHEINAHDTNGMHECRYAIDRSNNIKVLLTYVGDIINDAYGNIVAELNVFIDASWINVAEINVIGLDKIDYSKSYPQPTADYPYGATYRFFSDTGYWSKTITFTGIDKVVAEKTSFRLFLLTLVIGALLSFVIRIVFDIFKEYDLARLKLPPPGCKKSGQGIIDSAVPPSDKS